MLFNLAKNTRFLKAHALKSILLNLVIKDMHASIMYTLIKQPCIFSHCLCKILQVKCCRYFGSRGVAVSICWMRIIA